jgi:hypothetical protein
MSRSQSQQSELLTRELAALNSKTKAAKAAKAAKANSKPQPKPTEPQLVTYADISEGDRLFGTLTPDLILVVLRKIDDPGSEHYGWPPRGTVELALEEDERRVISFYEREFDERRFLRLPPEPAKTATNRSYFSEAARRKIMKIEDEEERKPEDDFNAVAPLQPAIIQSQSTRDKRAARRASSPAYRK